MKDVLRYGAKNDGDMTNELTTEQMDRISAATRGLSEILQDLLGDDETVASA